MNSNKIFALIEKIASVSGKKEKESLLKGGVEADDGTLARVLERAYNPLYSYGVRSLPARAAANPDGAVFDSLTFAVIDNLRERILSGNAAIAALQTEFDRLSADSAELLRRVVLKDMRAGFSDSTMNKVRKGWVPEFPYMRCSLPKHVKLHEWDWVNGVLSQEKADGMFFNIDMPVGEGVQFKTRQGTPAPEGCFPEVERQLGTYFTPGFQRHGEMLVERHGQILPREEGNGILNSVLQGGAFGPGERPLLKLWDEVPLACIVPKGRSEKPYSARLAGLITCLTRLKAELGDAPPAIELIETKMVFSIQEAYAHYAALLAQGKEGTIIKKRSAA
ncbi:hypothetical protein [Chromobacterium phragmitis]|uniref:Uncharacterized protein n=1 Tax=Chromobacterium phragmitis TaxID=2202141 RepID=A0ABV0J317_9NEIS